MRIPSVALLAIAAALLVSSCLNYKGFDLPTTEQVEQIFVTDIHVEVEAHEVPSSVPMLMDSELGGWRLLCDECHNGPEYSSYTILNWGHRDGCLQDSSCDSCHGHDLHSMDVRGHKSLCYECHIGREVSVACENCHSREHLADKRPHAPNFLGNHGEHEAEMEFSCYECHGSEQWCFACHGITMPHPADIIESHPEIVQGQPQTCANCHGSQSCLRCHTAYGVVIDVAPGG